MPQAKLKFLLAILGVALASGAWELALRAKGDPLGSAIKSYLYYPPHYIHCYASDPYASFPLDLGTAEGRKYMRTILQDWKKVRQLRSLQPHCIAYDLSPASGRRWIDNPERRATWALIGDSFAFGEGVLDKDTLGRRLATKLSIAIRSYASSGAGIAEIKKQLDSALAERQRYGFDRVLYLFVLNDPLISKKLANRELWINDLVNLRPENLRDPGDANFLGNLLWRAGSYSALAGRLSRGQRLRQIEDETIAWYRNVFDPAKNPRLEETFATIANMRSRANDLGMGFDMVVHPLLVKLDDYPFEAAHMKIKELCAKYRIEAIDLLDTFKGMDASKLTLHPFDSHPNAEANILSAEAVAKVLADKVKGKAL